MANENQTFTIPDIRNSRPMDDWKGDVLPGRAAREINPADLRPLVEDIRYSIAAHEKRQAELINSLNEEEAHLATLRRLHDVLSGPQPAGSATEALRRY